MPVCVIAANFLDRPAQAAGVDEVLAADPQQPLHLLAALAFVRHIMNIGRHRLAGSLMRQGNAQVDDPQRCKHGRYMVSDVSRKINRR